MFRPAKQSHVTEDIIRQIEEAIIDRYLKPGHRLAPERALQELFRTSRGAVREALGALKQKGLIEIRRGGKGGAYVKRVSLDTVSEGLALLISYRRVKLLHLAEFRETVEGMAAGLAAERAAPDDVEALKRLLHEAARCIEKGRDSRQEFYNVEMKLHQKLAQMSGNPILEWVLTTIQLNLHSYAPLMLWDKKGPQEALSDWIEILEGIEKREGTKVSSLMKAHVMRFNRYLKEGAKRLGLSALYEEDLTA